MSKSHWQGNFWRIAPRFTKFANNPLPKFSCIRYYCMALLLILYMGNIWWGKFWRTMQVKGSYWWGKIWWISNSQWICHIRFSCICEYWLGKFWWMAHDFQVFPYQNFHMYGKCNMVSMNSTLLFTLLTMPWQKE